MKAHHVKHISNFLALLAFCATLGCQTSDESPCVDNPQAENCEPTEGEPENSSNGSDTANPADETDTVDPNPEPEPETEPEETTDPLSGEAPAYHDLESLLAHLTALTKLQLPTTTIEHPERAAMKHPSIT